DGDRRLGALPGVSRGELRDRTRPRRERRHGDVSAPRAMDAGGNVNAARFDLFADLFAEQRRAWLRLLNTPRVAEIALGTEVGSTPHDVVYESGTLRLLRYRRATPARY